MWRLDTALVAAMRIIFQMHENTTNATAECGHWRVAFNLVASLFSTYVVVVFLVFVAVFYCYCCFLLLLFLLFFVIVAVFLVVAILFVLLLFLLLLPKISEKNCNNFHMLATNINQYESVEAYTHTYIHSTTHTHI